MPDLGPMPTSTPLGPVEIQILLNVIAVYRQGPTIQVPAGQQVDPVQLAQIERRLQAMLVESETLGA
jgi:hypothetical protein